MMYYFTFIFFLFPHITAGLSFSSRFSLTCSIIKGYKLHVGSNGAQLP